MAFTFCCKLFGIIFVYRVEHRAIVPVLLRRELFKADCVWPGSLCSAIVGPAVNKEKEQGQAKADLEHAQMVKSLPTV